MIEKALTLLLIATCVCMGQQVGTDRTETHPPITTYTCTSSGCTSQSRALTLDANWRWLHNVGGSNNCYKGNTWVSDYCTDPDKCLTNCALDGADYSGTFGVTTSGSSVTLKLVTVGSYSTNIGSRLFVMASDSKYEMFKLLNKEFAFDVDVSNVPCGLNGALYLVEMDETGNKGVGNNAAGAKYGTGYCDAQCPHDIKYINGQANLYNWTGYSANSGYGMYGSCCGEMDVWESNKISAALTPHNCVNEGLYRCSGKTECGDGVYRYSGKCDKDGCDWNHYRMGNTDFYGAGKTVDTSKSFTVVTQFITADGTDTGELVEIRRYYKQSGVVIPNSYSSYSALSGFNSVTDNMCTASKSLFGDTNDFSAKGGMKTQGEMLSRGMVMVISLWEDYQANMLWLDATNYPTNGSSSTPGVPRGTCSTSSGVPTEIESSSPNSYVIFSNLKVGPFGTTTSGVPVPGSSESSATGTTNVDSSSPTTLIESESNTPEAESSITLTPADSEASMIQIGVATIAISVALIA